MSEAMKLKSKSGETVSIAMIEDKPKETELREAYRDFFREWDWDLHATLHFSKAFSPQVVDGMVRKHFLDQIKRLYGKEIKLAGIFVIPVNQHTGIPHVHVLLISDHGWKMNFLNIDGKELRRMENMWIESCEITRKGQWDNETITSYLTNYKNFPINQSYWGSNNDKIIDTWGPHPYKTARLEKLKTKARPELRPEYSEFKEPTWNAERIQRTPIIKL